MALRREMAVTNVLNIPEAHREFIVARCVDNQLWYYNSWDTVEDAAKAAVEADGVVLVGAPEIWKGEENLCTI